MAVDTPRVTTRQDLPDEMSRSEISNRHSRRSGPRTSPPALLWLLLSFLLALAFGALLWMLEPPSQSTTRSFADIVAPQAPPPRAR